MNALLPHKADTHQMLQHVLCVLRLQKKLLPLPHHLSPVTLFFERAEISQEKQVGESISKVMYRESCKSRQHFNHKNEN
jgi:hypothetical protein